MIDKDTLIEVVNKYNGTVGYTIQDYGIHRNFYPNETKRIKFEELEKLSYEPGGDVILKDFLEIKNNEAIFQIFNKEMEPEYHYSIEDIKNVMQNGSLDQFLDCLDFAPEAVKDTIKDIAVELPLNDMKKRDAIKEKMGFDVTKAIEVKEEDESDSEKGVQKSAGRRAAPISTAAPTGRRYQPE